MSGIVVWLTGLPASGKSTIAEILVEKLRSGSVPAARLESDALRRVLTPSPDWSSEERDHFYEKLAGLAALLARQGLVVVVDATAPRRRYRSRARRLAPAFFEVFVDTPIDVCRDRDPKGLWRKSRRGRAPNLPGSGEVYEKPRRPELRIDGTLPPVQAATLLAGAIPRRYTIGSLGRLDRAQPSRRSTSTARRGSPSGLQNRRFQ